MIKMNDMMTKKNIENKMAVEKVRIEEFQLDITEGTKKMICDFHQKAVASRNEYVQNLIREFHVYRETIYLQLQERVKKKMPKENTDLETMKKKIQTIDELIEYHNPYNEAEDKLGLTHIIYRLNEKIDLETLNQLLLEFFNKMDLAKLSLTKMDFSYSPFTFEYMETFLEYKDKERFAEVIKTTFDHVYWECPNIIEHIRLNIRYLVQKYSKELNNYCNVHLKQLLEAEKVNDKDYLDLYEQRLNSYEQAYNLDPFLNLKHFLSRDLKINDYMESSAYRQTIFNKFIDPISFSNLDTLEKERYYSDIKSLSRTVKELKYYYKFKHIIDDILKRYKERESYKGVYQQKLKEISLEEKERDKILNSYLKYFKGGFFFKRNQTNKKIEKMRLATQVNKMIPLYKELDDHMLNDKILTHLNDGSTLDDVIDIASSFYFYLNDMFLFIFGENCNTKQLYQEIFEFCNSPHGIFMTQINILSQFDMAEIIYDKYRLLNINVEKQELEEDNLDKLMDKLNVILLVQSIEKSSLSFEEIQFICEVSNLNY